MIQEFKCACGNRWSGKSHKCSEGGFLGYPKPLKGYPLPAGPWTEEDF